ncbi:hypothetical protein D3H65_26055 [Paraflavitalea soli]|uniref:Uncharacterized protein n=1 Tax=Paraflavitalea soli TaxID=2315862 RepID=A0A3B7MRR9_9BACT|nr:hypothetical protein D3H65_26055 [Paraflavitalea soli]
MVVQQVSLSVLIKDLLNVCLGLLKWLSIGFWLILGGNFNRNFFYPLLGMQYFVWLRFSEQYAGNRYLLYFIIRFGL